VWSNLLSQIHLNDAVRVRTKLQIRSLLFDTLFTSSCFDSLENCSRLSGALLRDNPGVPVAAGVGGAEGAEGRRGVGEEEVGGGGEGGGREGEEGRGQWFGPSSDWSLAVSFKCP
jgi:hypothetical protein